MAELKSYFSLCSIAGSTPLGVEPDAGSSPGIIFTLSRNVIMRYRMSDQKQVGGWTSKEFVTAPVVYDTAENSYVGVFSENKIKMWPEDVENLDKIKKIKFSQPIYKLLTGKNGKTTLMFKDGSCASLTYATYAKKNLETVSFLNQDDAVVDASIFDIDDDSYVCLLVEDSKKTYSVITCLLNTDINTLNLDTLKRFNVQREEFPNGRVIGLTIAAKADVPQVFVIWSDGRLFSMKLLQDDFTLIGQVPWLSYEINMNLVWLGENHIALYGADAAQEGAVLVIYNVSFGIGSCRYPLKLFCAGARAWVLRDNLLLEANRQLAVVLFSLSSQRDALSLIGTNRSAGEDEKINQADWGNGKISWESEEKWKNEAERGVAERDISFQYLMSLMDGNNIDQIEKTLVEFTDISESLIVSLLTYTINKLTNIKNYLNVDYNHVFKENEKLRNLLDVLLVLPYLSDKLIPHLRNNLSMENTIVLLKYIDFVLNDKSIEIKYAAKYENNVLKWGSVLIDSHFQELLLGNNKDNFTVVKTLKSTLEDLIEDYHCIENVLSILNSISTAHKEENQTNISESALYYIEEVKLF